MLNNKECLVCKVDIGLHAHHVFYGTGNRKLSEKYDMKVWLCGKHHNLSNEGVHMNRKRDLAVKQYAQLKFEAEHGHDKFMETFGRNYL